MLLDFCKMEENYSKLMHLNDNFYHFSGNMGWNGPVEDQAKALEHVLFQTLTVGTGSGDWKSPTKVGQCFSEPTSLSASRPVPLWACIKPPESSSGGLKRTDCMRQMAWKSILHKWHAPNKLWNKTDQFPLFSFSLSPCWPSDSTEMMWKPMPAYTGGQWYNQWWGIAVANTLKGKSDSLFYLLSSEKGQTP